MNDSTARAERFDPAPSITPFYTWEVPQKPVLVRLPLLLIDQLEREAVETFRSVSSRGSEIGGLLWGSVEPGDPVGLSVVEYELVECDYSRGPLYRLSESELAKIDRALAQRGSGLRPLGFFRSHTRKGLLLDPDDLAVMDARFPEPHQIALVIRPAATKASTAGVFFRENGQFRAEASYLEFPFRSAQLAPQKHLADVMESAANASAPPAAPKPTVRAQIVPIASRRDITAVPPVVAEAPPPTAPSAPEPVAAPVPQPVAQAVVQPTPQPLPQPVAQPVPQPVPQPLPQPIAQPLPKAATPSVAQRLAQPSAPTPVEKPEVTPAAAEKRETEVPPAEKRENATEKKAPVAAKPAAAEKKAGAEEKKAAVDDKKAPVEAKKTSVEEKKAPAEAKKAAVEDKKAPVEDKKVPVVEKKAPVVEKKAPAEEIAVVSVASAAAARPKSAGKLIWFAVGTIFPLLLSGVLFVYPGIFRKVNLPGAISGQDSSPLALRVENTGSELLLTWNNDSSAIRNATRAVLSISDGDQHENVEMDLAQLRNGRIEYLPVTGDVVFRMEVSGKDNNKTASGSVRVLRTRPSAMPQEGQAQPAQNAGAKPPAPNSAAPNTPAPSTPAAGAPPSDLASAKEAATPASPAPTPSTPVKAFNTASLSERLRPVRPDEIALPDAPTVGGGGGVATSDAALKLTGMATADARASPQERSAGLRSQTGRRNFRLTFGRRCDTGAGNLQKESRLPLACPQRRSQGRRGTGRHHRGQWARQVGKGGQGPSAAAEGRRGCGHAMAVQAHHAERASGGNRDHDHPELRQRPAVSTSS